MNVMDTDQTEAFDLLIDRLEDAHHLANLANGHHVDSFPDDPDEKPFHTQYAETIDGIASLLRQMRVESHPMIEFLAQGYLHIQSAAGGYRQQDAQHWLDDARQRLALEEVKTELFCEPKPEPTQVEQNVLSVADVAQQLRSHVVLCGQPLNVVKT